jgi:GNAT superfamily N-acetyltransferase
MELSWARETSPRWDADKQRVIGGAPPGTFVLPFTAGEELPGEWWSVRDGAGTVVAFGRLDITWGGDAEILLAVDPGRQREGIGTFVLGQLESEAAARGINYIRNRIRDHAERDLVHDWLVVRGFRGPLDGDLRKGVNGDRTPTRVAPREPEVYDVNADAGGRAPGREEQGGYVDIEEHRY